MKLSDRGLLEITEHEGIVPAPYRDSVGVWTFGIGHTAAAGGIDPRTLSPSMPADVERAIDRALAIFREDVVSYETRVARAFPVPMEQHQFDALVSWDFNTGGATWRSSTGKPCQLVQQVNRGDFSGEGFMGWLRPPEIRKRRTAEQRLFLTGDYDANGSDIPVWRTNGAGKLLGIMATIDGGELLERMGRGQPRDYAEEGQGGTPPTSRAPSGLLAALLAALFKRS